MTDALRDALDRATGELGLDPPSSAWARLERMIGLWRRYAATAGLTGARDDRGLIEHIGEGLATVACATALAAPSGRWLEVGAGGGFPGLVVAALGSWPMVLVEPRAKRAAFLELSLGVLDRRDCRVSRARWDGATWNESGVEQEIFLHEWHPEILSARAVFDADRWLQEAPRMANGAAWVLLHGHSGDPSWPDEVAAVELGRWRISARQVVGPAGLRST